MQDSTEARTPLLRYPSPLLQLLLLLSLGRRPSSTYLNGVVDELCHGVWYLAEVSVAGLGDGVEVRLV